MESCITNMIIHIKFIVRLKQPVKKRVKGEAQKFFEKLCTIEAAREELKEIVKASGNNKDSKNAKLVK